MIIENTQMHGKGSDDFWPRAEENLLKAFEFYLMENKVEKNTLADIYSKIAREDIAEIDTIFKKLPQDSPARMSYNIYASGSETIKSSVLTGLGTRLQAFQNKYVQRLTECSDIDFKNGIININKSSQYLSEKGVFTKAPKTESSIRDVAIPDFIVSLLEEYKLWYDEQKSIVGDFWCESSRLFVQDDGKPIHPSTISKWFEQFVKKIGLPVINFHGLRHTNATLLISQQVDVATVSARLGHAQITTTYNFYVHPLKSHDRTAGNVLENLLISCKAD